jgi:23S rRNA (adenine1618-N6)-methyltransferase
MVNLKTELHPRNRHRDSYPFKELIKSFKGLAPFLKKNSFGNESIDFTNPAAVKALNQALLKHFYHITWDIPDPFLCPPIPSRADYIHHIADLHNSSNISKGKDVHILDIGVGANCIYPLIGHQEYGWSFVGTDINPLAVKIAEEIINANALADFIKIRLQKSPSKIFEGVINAQDRFDVSICNPPFHASLEEAQAGTRRKWKNLGIKTKALNFGGTNQELYCPGGEVSFIKEMIKESVHVNCRWFTTLVSKESSLPSLYKALDSVRAQDVKTIAMSQGQKKSRIIAWTFGRILKGA